MEPLIQISAYSYLSKLDYKEDSICTKCGGACCKQHSGPAWPEQFGASDINDLLFNLIQAFQSGKWSVDCWEDYPSGPGYYIRPRHTNTDQIVDYSWGGQCVFLTNSGCSLNRKDMPLECRLLIPSTDNVCKYQDIKGNGKLASAQAWEPYSHIIDQAIKEVEIIKKNNELSIRC